MSWIMPNIYKLSLDILVILLLGIQTSLAIDTEEVKVEFGKPLSLNIARAEINKIQFGSKRLIKLIGDTAHLKTMISNNGDLLFVSSNLSSGKVINCTSIFASGESLDLSLTIIKNKQPKLINLVFPSKGHKLLEQEEMTEMMKAMRSNIVGKYYVQYNGIISKTPELLKEGVSIRWTKLYRFGKYEGRVMDLQNLSNHTIELKASDLKKRYRNIKSLAINNKSLQAKQTTNAYIVLGGR